MDTIFLAKAFGVWSGWAYRFQGEIPEGADAAHWITAKTSEVLGRSDFISTVATINGENYLYVTERLPGSDLFFEIGDLSPVYQPPEDSENNGLEDETAPEGENDAG
jgi:hypothetical protein